MTVLETLDMSSVSISVLMVEQTGKNESKDEAVRSWARSNHFVPHGRTGMFCNAELWSVASLAIAQ